VDVGDLLVVEGQAQAGKTAMLLTLAGRMKPHSGRLTVLGYSLPVQASAVRAITGLGVVQGVNDLDPLLTVEQHLAERLIFQRPWWRRARVSREVVSSYLDRINGALARLADSPLQLANATRPPTLAGDHVVGDLSPLEAYVLSASLALVGDPQVLIVDDIDALRERESRLVAWSTLLALLAVRRTLTIVASCEDATDLGHLLAHDPGQRIARSRVKVVRVNRIPPIA
jgi:ABC-type uncharacterized transport system ATPase subunit